MATYDLNQIAEALRDLYQGRTVLVVNGEDVPLNAYADMPGDVPVPALVIDLADVDWDLTFQRGAEAATFLVRMLVSTADTPGGQRTLRAALSSGGVATRLKDVLEADKTLGGLVSYAIMSSPSAVGSITYAGVEYIGATIPIEVTVQ